MVTINVCDLQKQKDKLLQCHIASDDEKLMKNRKTLHMKTNEDSDYMLTEFNNEEVIICH